jgi:hypothetical protein
MAYTSTDKSIDDYLGTKNLRPGPAKRLVNRVENARKNVEQIKINIIGTHLKLQRNINWKE